MNIVKLKVSGNFYKYLIKRYTSMIKLKMNDNNHYNNTTNDNDDFDNINNKKDNNNNKTFLYCTIISFKFCRTILKHCLDTKHLRIYFFILIPSSSY